MAIYFRTQYAVPTPEEPFRPQREARARVKDPLPVPILCRYCGGSVRVAHHSEIYNGKSYGTWPWVYLCPDCGAHVGIHQDTDIPLGILADSDLRRSRAGCKGPFERLHQVKRLTRSEAYGLLAKKLGIPIEECHFGWFDTAMCKKATLATCAIYFEN